MNPIIKYEMAHVSSNIINNDEDVIGLDSVPDIDEDFYDQNSNKYQNLMNKQQYLLRKNIQKLICKTVNGNIKTKDNLRL